MSDTKELMKPTLDELGNALVQAIFGDEYKVQKKILTNGKRTTQRTQPNDYDRYDVLA